MTKPGGLHAWRLATRATAALVVSLCVLGAAASPVGAQQPEPRFLAKEQIVLYGIGLKAEPARQVVPKDIATIVSTFLQAPTLPNGLSAFDDAEVRATLRGPSFAEAQELVVRPNTPFTIPPLKVAGIHTLEDIRLTSHGEVLLRAVPESVVIEVIEKLLVTQVTARALTAAEIREKGIVFDRSSFQAYNFSAAFAIQDQRVQIDFPVVLPQIAAVPDVAVGQVGVPQIPVPSLPSLQTIIPDTLKLQTQIPNLSVVGFTLKVPTLEGQDLLVPPIPGVIVIPGDIGFLNQFFSVNLMVGNVAPAGSNLVVSDLEADIVLPAGNDKVVGSGDDPLRMARTASGETARKKLVVQAGPDGQLGTADDIATLGPGETGNAEYLVEGMREGSHVVEMEMKGILHGLPVGPVEIRGRAAGSVLVRNPAFSLTFTHPEVVSAGEPYTLDVTVTNTSESPANFVSLNLYPRNVSGATIVGSNTREIESVLPGDSATVTFDLVSNITGNVTAATLDSNENVAGRFALKTAVGELGVPLSPDSLVLPKESRSLPKSVRDAAIGLLGKAWAVATAPAAALPADVRRFSKKIVLDRAVEVAESGFRVALHEPLADSVAQLAMDVAGNKYTWLPLANANPGDLAFAQNNFTGFDALRRQSVRGDRFADAVGAVLADALAGKGAATFHSELASRWSYRPSHMSALVTGAAGPAPYRLSILDDQGRRVGGPGTNNDANHKVLKQIPFADVWPLGSAGEIAVLASPAAALYTVRLDRVDGVPDGTPYALSLVLPDATGNLRQLTFQGVTGQAIPVVPPSADSYQFRVQVFDAGAQAPGAAIAPQLTAVVDPPPTIFGAVQQVDADGVRCDKDSPPIPLGRVVAVLFSEELTPEAVQDKLAADAITKYAIDGNQVVGVALQPGRRIAFLALRDPVGPFVAKQLTVADVVDLRGQPMPAASVPIESTIGDDGGVVSGRVMQADGTPVPLAKVSLFYVLKCDLGERTIGVSSKAADAQGRYGWDFVSRRMANRIVAVDGATGDSRDLRYTVQRNGQRLNVDVVFLGRGTFKGRTLAEDGRALSGTAVRVTSLTDNSQFGATTDVSGRFEIAQIPVGNLLVEAVNVNARAQFFFSENIPFAGASVSRDITLLDVPKRDLTIKTGLVQGFVYQPDGVTPIADAPIIAYYQNRSQAGVPCPAIGFPPKEPIECAVAVVRSSATGAFQMPGVTAGELRLYAFDAASLSQGGAGVALPPNGTRAVNILLVGGLGTVTGVVVDPSGAPVAGARVGGGFTLVTTNAQGQFTLTDVPVGHRDIVAVSDTLGTSATAAVDLVRAGESVGVTLVLESVGSVAGVVRRADGTTPVPNVPVYVFRYVNSDDGPQIRIFGTAVTDPNGVYRIDHLPMGTFTISAFDSGFTDGNIGKVVLKFHQQVFKADITFRGGGGSVHGVVFDDDGQTPLKARLGISGDQLIVAGGQVGVGFQYVPNFRIVDTDIATGRYNFGGLWVGGFTLRAVGQFSPDPIAVEGSVTTPNESVELNLKLQATSQVGGIVYAPDGVTPAGANVVVTYKSNAFKVICSEDRFGEETCVTIPQGIQEVNAVTDAQGRFFFPIVNAGSFTLSADDPATGKLAQISGAVKAGESADLSMRLLGTADLNVQVLGSDTVTPIPNAKVEVEQLAYPKKKKTLIAGPDGTIAFAGGDAFSEGELVIVATDQSNGTNGRAAATIVKDGQNVVVKAFLYNAAGTVYGTIFQADGINPAPNADVVISNAAGPLAFAVSGADGTYRVNDVPLGAFTVDTFDPVTARRAFAAGEIPFEDQQVPINMVLGGLGIVRGTLLAGGTLAALKGWEITLAQVSRSGRRLPEQKTTTAVDGSWSFPGTSRGTFTLHARKQDVQGTTGAAGEIEREGQIVEVPLIVNSLRPLAGRVEGTVFNADGTRAANNVLEICYAGRCTDQVPPLRVTADPQGFYFADDIPLGRFRVTATSQTTRNAGKRFADMELDGDVVTLDVAMVGLTEISGTVIRANGTPATNAVVTLDGSPATGCEGPCTQGVKPADGTFSFVDVPAQRFTIRATDAVTGLKGVAGGTLNAGEHKIVTIVLEPTGSVLGRVFRAAGQPAQGIVAELILSPGAPNERRLYGESGSDGAFLFDTAPLVAFTLNLQDPVGGGLAVRTGTVAGNGDVGDVLLDEAPPTVATTVPAASATAVPRNQIVRIVFAEPILPGTVNPATVVLEGPAGPVATVLNVGEGDTAVTVTPLSPLKDETRYTIRVSDVKDRVGKTMPARFTSTFTTVDITPPGFVSLSPAVNGNGAPVVTPVRIQFTEPIDPEKFRAPAFTLSGSQGAIAGRLDYTLGNTVLVFTPNLPLAEAATYRVQMSAAVDPAGNAQPQDLDYVFRTTDRTPPQVLGLQTAASAIEFTTATVTADLGVSHDVAVVDWYLNDVFAFAGRSTPFAFAFKVNPELGVPGSQIKVSAVATDTSGNRGAMPVSAFIAVTADQPPLASITTPTGPVSARNGDRITVNVGASDDVGLTQIGYKANTGLTQDSSTRTFSAVAQRTESFAFNVPASAAPGSTFTIEASAVDTRGHVVQAAPIAVTVVDAVNPVVTITGTTSGAKVNPGQTTTAIVSAEDLGGLTSMTFTIGGIISSTETRPIDPAQPSVAASFSIHVPANARPGDSLTLDATAVDRAGNRGTAARVILPVADTVAPTVRMSTDSAELVLGRPITVFVDAEDEIALSRVELTGQGAFTMADAKPVSPPLGSARVAFTINVPDTLDPGAILNLRATAVDISGNVSAPASLALAVRSLAAVTLPASTIVIAGESVPVAVQLSEPAPVGGLRVDFTSVNTNVATVTASVQFAAGETTRPIQITGVSGGSASIRALIQGVQRASMTATVRGGIVRGVVFDSSLQPVGGAQLTINGAVTATTNAGGEYFAEGVPGSSVVVKAVDLISHQRGTVTAAMSRPGGFAIVNLVLVPGGAIRGSVKTVADAAAGAAVKVDLYASNAPTTLLAFAFSDEASQYEFPVVTPGSYILIATGPDGHRGRATVTIPATGDEMVVPITYLGEGTVAGTVLDAAGVAVPRASLTFTSVSVFGAAAPTVKNAEADGTFRFERVAVGTFTVQAKDNVTGQGGATSGEITNEGQVVPADVHLSTFGNVRGVVRRPDGVTPAVGAVVRIASHSTVTNDLGEYSFSFLPLGAFTVTVNDAGTRQQGRATGTLTTQGETQTVDVTLHPQGTLVVTVTNAGGTRIANAAVQVIASGGGFSDTLSGTTGSDGVVVIARVLAGTATISATSGVLHASTATTLAAGETKPITLALESTGSIAGVVYLPDGQTPASGARVSTSIRSFTTGADGAYHLDELPLAASYALSVTDAQGRLRAKTTTVIQIPLGGDVVTRNFTFVGLGTVTGRVLNPDSSSAQNLTVNVRSFNPDFGGVRAATTNAGGFYTVTSVAVGAVSVSTGDVSRLLLGEGSGTIAEDGATATIDILLVGNAVTPPVQRWDANNYSIDVQRDGTLRTGSNSFRALGGLGLDVVSGGVPARFEGGPIATIENGGREVAVRQLGIGGLNVTRKIAAPRAGYFARYLDAFSNPTATPVTIDVRVTSNTQHTLVWKTSSGDAALDVSAIDTADRWIVLDDSVDSDTGIPATAFVFDGPGGATRAGAATVSAASPRDLTFEWRSVTVPANGTVAFLYFVAQQTGRAAAQASAERLVQLPPEALDGLSLDEIAQIANFAVPADGASTLPPLPSVLGVVDGRVQAWDAAIPIGSSAIRFRSGNIFYGRAHVIVTGADGRFTFSGVLNDSGSSRAVPVDAFTLRADHPTLGAALQSPIVTGAFDGAATAVTQDVVFSNTGVLRGTVRFNGVAIGGATIALTSPGSAQSAVTGSNGGYVFALMPVGVFTAKATATVQGTTASATVTGTVTAGTTTIVDIVIDTIAPQLTIDTPAAGAAIDPRTPLAVTVTAADVGGVAAVTFSTTGAVVRSENRGGLATSPRTDTFMVPFDAPLPTGGTLTLTVTATDAAGNVATATRTVAVRDVVAPAVVEIAPANGATDVELNAVVIVRFSESIDPATVTAASLRLSRGMTDVPVTLTFADNDRVVTLTPAQPLALNSTYTVTVEAAVRDVAGNALAAPVVTTFTTRPPDVTAPRVAAIAPANNAVDVPVGSFVQVTFTEPIDPATITAASARVSRDGTALNGTFVLLNGNRDVRFMPAQPLPFGAVIVTELAPSIADASGNPLADANGAPLQAPLTFTFLTASFGLTSPARGQDLLEKRTTTLEAQGSASLAIATMTFVVNGQALPAVAGPPFRSLYDVPAASVAPSLTITAIARNSGGVEVARDEATFRVIAGLQAQPTLLGIKTGGTEILRLGLTSPIAVDLPITLTAGNAAVVSLPQAPVVLPAGQTEVAVPIGGTAAGNTTIAATSPNGDAAVIAAVSPAIAKTVNTYSPIPGVRLLSVALVGRVFAPLTAQRTVTLQLTGAPVTAGTIVTVGSSNAAIARVDAPIAIDAGGDSAEVTIVTGTAGVASLTFRAGSEIRQLTIVVGTPTPDLLGPIVAAPAGAFVLPGFSVGRVLAPESGHGVFTLPLLPTAATAPTPVTITSSNAAVASVPAAVTIAAGERTAIVDITTGTPGTATLVFRAGGEVRVLTVVVGQPSAADIPLTIAPAVGARLLSRPVVGVLLAGLAARPAITPALLSAPRAVDTIVTIATSNANVATAPATVTIPAGQVAATFEVTTGTQGVATLTIDIDGQKRELTVVVGTPPAGMVPAIVAPVIGITRQ